MFTAPSMCAFLYSSSLLRSTKMTSAFREFKRLYAFSGSISSVLKILMEAQETKWENIIIQRNLRRSFIFDNGFFLKPIKVVFVALVHSE